MTPTPQVMYTAGVKRKAVERKPGMRRRSQAQLEAELAAAIVRRIAQRVRVAKQQEADAACQSH